MVYNIPLHIIHPADGEFQSFGLRNCDAPALPQYITEAITLIGGRNYYGEPRMRIIWGMRLFHVQCGVLRLRYPMQSWCADDGYIYDVGLPRFMIEQKLDPKSEKGQYRDLMCVQTMDGHYCLPDQRHLDELMAMDYRRRHDATYGVSESEPLPEYAKAFKITKMADDERARKEAKKKERQYTIRDHYNEHRRQLFTQRPWAGRVRRKGALQKAS